VGGAGICFLEATELARLIRVRELSAQEVTAACLEQTELTNPHVNAIVTLVPERAMRDARAADEILAEALAYGEDVAPLHGLPVAHKDLAPTRGIRTTFGSLVYEDFIPDEDALVVERTEFLQDAPCPIGGNTRSQNPAWMLSNNLLVPGSFMKRSGPGCRTTSHHGDRAGVHGRASAAADSISSPTSLLWAVSSV